MLRSVFLLRGETLQNFSIFTAENNKEKRRSMIPQDPMILFSFINMKLRDEYSSLTALCEDMEINEAELTEKLKGAGFEYNETNNKFW